MSVAEMRMLRWMCGKSRKDKIRNDAIRARLGVASIDDKMRESRLRWFGHVRKRLVSAPVRKCESVEDGGQRKGRGKPLTTWVRVIERDMEIVDLDEQVTLDRSDGIEKFMLAN